MIDLLIVKGTIGMPQPHHQTCLSTVTYSRFLQSKTKPTTTFVNSPITGTQIDLQYGVEETGGSAIAIVQIRIALASATVGDNFVHAGLETVSKEVKCAALLIKISLTVLGFKPEEVSLFMKTAAAVLLELTWHTATASNRARLSAQRRTKGFFKAQLLLSGRHDMSVCGVSYREDNGKPGLLVTLKSGDALRQYGKADEISSRKKSSRKGRSKFGLAKIDRQIVVSVIEHHVRNEVLAGEATLQNLGSSHPGSWTAETLKQVIDCVWEQAGFTPKSLPADTELSPEAEATWQRHCDGVDMSKELSASTFSRHRASIKLAKGEDIAGRRKARAVRADHLGYQHCYARRWNPAGDMRKAALCEVTAPAIIEELERGLAFIQSGTVPAIEDAEERGQWLGRWTAFVAREGGRRHEAK